MRWKRCIHSLHHLVRNTYLSTKYEDTLEAKEDRPSKRLQRIGIRETPTYHSLEVVPFSKSLSFAIPTATPSTSSGPSIVDLITSTEEKMVPSILPSGSSYEGTSEYDWFVDDLTKIWVMSSQTAPLMKGI
ncbi:hypothetical protein L6452_01999 [Arctium lappa]|uniref:Uncharacterized protein n=1 Tax=Arctium lappa TaxID=4217 RepID=A0ACB9FI58_ARCLA|nr:hypothetical protein L6452_01999 [Arctium lappa]